MSDRNDILARIREGLSIPAPHLNGHAKPGNFKPTDFRGVLPTVGRNLDENFALFAKNAVDLRADFKRVKNMEEAICALKALAKAESWTQAASHTGPLTTTACQGLGLPVFLTDKPFDKFALEKCPVGITECDALVAQTGSVVVTSRSSGGRALTVLPPHHVVLAREDQLVPGLPDAFALMRTRYGASFPSMISFITGPSRTGDIERILVLGAHGPKKLTILCLEST